MVRQQGIYNPQPRPDDDRPHRFRARHPHQQHQPQGDGGQHFQDDRNPFHGHPQRGRKPHLGIPQHSLFERTSQRSQDHQHGGQVIFRNLGPFLFHRSGSPHRQFLQQHRLLGTLLGQHRQDFIGDILLPFLGQHRKEFLRIIFLPFFRQLQFLQVFLFR